MRWIVVGMAAVLAWVLAKGTADGGEPRQDAVPGDDVAKPPMISNGVKLLAHAIAVAEGFFVPGAAPNRGHNPGSLKPLGWTGPKVGTEGIAAFESDQEGWMALYHQLHLIETGTSHVYTRDMTIAEMAAKWTDTAGTAWATNVAADLDVSEDMTLDAIFTGEAFA